MRFQKYLVGFGLALTLVACGGGGGSPGLPTVTVTAISTTAPPTLNVLAGGSQSFSIIGGKAPYQVSSSNAQVAVAVVADNTFLIGGISGGDADIVVTDAIGQSKTVKVTVGSSVDLFTTAPSSLTMAPATSRDFVIGGGQPPYSVTSNNATVATTGGSAGTVLNIAASKVGTATILITDAVGKTTSVGLTVASGGVPLALSPTSATTFVDLPVNVFLVGGTPPYRVGGSIPAAASVTQDPVDSTKFVVMPLLVSSGLDIVFLDSENAEAKFNLTVGIGQPTFRLSPSALTVAEKFATPFTLTAFGATGSVSAFSSDLTLLTVSVSGDIVTVNPSGKCVAANTSVTITVVDANRASATSVITVTNNGNVTGDCPS